MISRPGAPPHHTCGDALDLHFEFPAALRTSGRMLPFFCGQAQCCPAGRTSAIAEAAIVPYTHIRSFEKSGECVTHTQIFPVFPLSCGNIPWKKPWKLPHENAEQHHINYPRPDKAVHKHKNEKNDIRKPVKLVRAVTSVHESDEFIPEFHLSVQPFMTVFFR